mmetsp:Transcript_15608/g.44261  ORF Transcript_15608/g.44261 Transcript_15608/m.44261 type:complete len:319 (-) Transcript_15608:412-1368(-)
MRVHRKADGPHTPGVHLLEELQVATDELDGKVGGGAVARALEGLLWVMQLHPEATLHGVHLGHPVERNEPQVHPVGGLRRMVDHDTLSCHAKLTLLRLKEGNAVRRVELRLAQVRRHGLGLRQARQLLVVAPQPVLQLRRVLPGADVGWEVGGQGLLEHGELMLGGMVPQLDLGLVGRQRNGDGQWQGRAAADVALTQLQVGEVRDHRVQVVQRFPEIPQFHVHHAVLLHTLLREGVVRRQPPVVPQRVQCAKPQKLHLPGVERILRVRHAQEELLEGVVLRDRHGELPPVQGLRGDVNGLQPPRGAAQPHVLARRRR